MFTCLQNKRRHTFNRNLPHYEGAGNNEGRALLEVRAKPNSK